MSHQIQATSRWYASQGSAVPMTIYLVLRSQECAKMLLRIQWMKGALVLSKNFSRKNLAAAKKKVKRVGSVRMTPASQFAQNGGIETPCNCILNTIYCISRTSVL
mmetsp:Transcript_32502/g.78863  ORF Transcript_32502/g.78863 Transcript_32502/m.78863 type:complete len:105 (+) Transcript_32502:165-479(+)